MLTDYEKLLLEITIRDTIRYYTDYCEKNCWSMTIAEENRYLELIKDYENILRKIEKNYLTNK